MTSFLRDVRFGLRLLWRSPGFTAVAVMALALGIAANTSIFSVVYATILGPLPYHDPEQLVMVWSGIRGNRNSTAAGDFVEWKRQATAFQDINAWAGRGVNLAEGDRPERLDAFMPTPGFYTMIGMRFLLGRDFLPEEGEPGKDKVVILRYRLWEERFGSDRTIIGRAIRIDGTPHTVVGVLAPGPTDRGPVSLALPLAFTPDQLNHDFHWLLVMGRLKPDATIASANESMKAVSERLAEAHPMSNQGKSAQVEPFRNNFLPRETLAALWLLLGAVGFVLLIACANVANLLLARGTARQRELAVRASLGAGRGRLFRQLLTESVVLAFVGGALGVALASILLGTIMAILPPNTLPWEADVQLNVPVLLFTLAASTVSGILFGCVPAWQATRANLNDVLKEAGRSAIGGGQHRLRRMLVITEFALALALLAGGGLAIRSFVKLATVDLGFPTERLLTFGLGIRADRLEGGTPRETSEKINAFYQQLLERIQTVPGVSSAAVSTGIPVWGGGYGMAFSLADAPVQAVFDQPNTSFKMVTPGFVPTYGIQLLRGRTLTDQDRLGGQRVALVNESLVKRHLAGRDPLRQRLLVAEIVPGVQKLGPPVEWQIVGVYRNIRSGGPRDEGRNEMYVPFWQSPSPGVSISLRTTGDPASVVQSVASVLRGIDPDMPMVGVRTMDQILDENMAWDRFKTVLFAGFSAIALLLAAFGIYGVMSFTVAQRTHEIGLRMALGAGQSQVLREVLREGMITAFAGVALGSAGAWFVGRAMQGMWYDVGAIDPVAFTVVAAVLLASALLACLLPARRAAALDPLTALRQD